MENSSVLGEEIARFNKLADIWWDETGPMWPLHRLNALRVPFIERHIRSHFRLSDDVSLNGLSVLDVGCGAGVLSESLAALGARVHGIDAAERNIAIAVEHGQNSGLDVSYEVAAVEDIDASRRYDVVLNMEVVEHVDDVPVFMAHCAEKTRPGGLMFVATINRTAFSFLTAIVGAEYVLGWLPKGTHHWGQFVTPRETTHYLEAKGFEVSEMTGVGVNPLRKSLFLTANTAANYMLAAARQVDQLPQDGKGGRTCQANRGV